VKFKVDENLPFEFAEQLRRNRFDAETVSEEQLSGKEDVDLFEHCQEEDRILITLDLDFANLRAYPPSLHAGIIVFRAATQDKLTLLAILQRFIPVLQSKSPSRQLWIVEANRIRYRED
jgi:predicted nuclease of predicted toxin-antitoxin system